MSEQGYPVEIVEGEKADEHLALNVGLGGEQDFTYQVWPRQCAMPAFSIRNTQAGTRYYRLEVHIIEGGQGYDIYGYTQEQLIADILDQYERHLLFLHIQCEQPGTHTEMPDDPASAGR